MFRRLSVVAPAALFMVAVGDAAAAEAVDASAGASRPNILFFLSDDQRAGFLGCAGHPILKTPAIDRLAAEGVRFENAFVTTSICAASRATLLTGVVERTHKFTFGTPPVADELCETSFPALLRRAGYRTGHVGKFGVGVKRDTRETMFESFQPLDRSPYFKVQPVGGERHVDEIAGDLAIEFLRAKDDRPFCLQVCFNAPHAEDGDEANLYPPPPSAANLYADLPVPSPPLAGTGVFEALPEFLRTSLNRERWYWQFDTAAKYEKNVRDYYRMISGINGVIGRVLDELKRAGHDDDTVVIFSSDNGYFLGERGLSGKWIHYEESLRVPLIVRDPRPEAARRETRDATVLNLDIPATILDYAGVERPAVYQGRSLRPVVEGDLPADWRTDFFCEHLMEHPRLPRWEGVRTPRFTYARYFQQQPPFEFLHDREADPDQLTNFATDPDYADELQRMRARTNELRDSYGGAYSPEKFPLAERRPSLDGK